MRAAAIKLPWLRGIDRPHDAYAPTARQLAPGGEFRSGAESAEIPAGRLLIAGDVDISAGDFCRSCPFSCLGRPSPITGLTSTPLRPTPAIKAIHPVCAPD